MTPLRTILPLLTATIFLSQGNGQTINASLTGTITDPTGGTIAGAKVEIVETATNVRLTVLSRADGSYTAPSLPAGTYQVAVSANGFKTDRRTGVALDVSQNARLDLKLEVGSVTESVDVTGTAPLLDATTSSVGQVLSSSSIGNLPLNQRNPFSLVFLVPGVIGTVGPQFNSNNISANGGRPGTTEVLLDGTPSAPPGGVPYNVFTIFPSVDALQEFRVQTSNYAPEYGHSGSGIINMIYKSGTNQLHGTAFEFLRNSVMDSNSFYSNQAGTPLASFKRNQFGFTVGGPVVIPKLYDGRNKTFFFADYEGLRQRQASTLKGTVPTVLQRSGDFSQTLAQNGQKVVIYDPLTTVPSGASYARTPFPGNVIPANRIDPVAANVIKYYPLPNQPGSPFTATNNYYAAGEGLLNIDQWDFKVDENVNDANRFFVRVSHRDYDAPNPVGLFPAAIEAAAPEINGQEIGSGASVDYTRTNSPTFISDLRLGFSRSLFNQCLEGCGFNTDQLGLPAYIHDNAEIAMFPGFTPAGYLAIGSLGSGAQHTSYNSYSLLLGNTKISGPHVFKFGFEARMLFNGTHTSQQADGNFSFPVSLTQGPDPTKASTTGGSGLASMLLGLGSGTMSQDTKIFDTTAYYYGWYFGDDWKITSRLTLNVGVRYEIQVPRTERHDRMNYFDPNVASPLAGPAGIPDLMGGIVFVGVNGVGPRQFPIIWSNVAPRLGFAYKVGSKTIVRGGAGIFYISAPTGSAGVIGNTGYGATTSFVGSQNGLTPYSYLSNPFPTGLIPITGNSLGLLTSLGQALSEPLNTATVPYTENWSLGIQRELPGSILLDAIYVGNHSVNLIAGAEGNLNLNQLTPQQMALGAAVLQSVPNPFYGLITTGALSTPTVPKYYLLRPYPQYTTVGLLYPQGSDSIYNALQLKLEKRFEHGLSFLLSYAKQKLIDDNSAIENVGQNAASQNYYCRKCDRSVSANDISQQFIYSAVYALPFGRGRRFGGSWNRAVDGVLGGWQANAILTLQTGFPLNILESTDTTLGSTTAGNQSLRPNNNGHSAQLSGPIENRLNEYFNTSVFSAPAPFTFGDTGRTLPDVRGPGIHNLDFSVFKNFRIKERFTAEFRGEAFNITNSVQFGLPNTSLGSNQFGVISTQTNSPRQVQIGLKLRW